MPAASIFSLSDVLEGEFVPFRAGIDMRVLYGAPGKGGAAAAFLRYQPGAKVPAHEHPGYELIQVLVGSQTDERGTHRAGTFVVNPPGSRHAVESAEGCVVLAVWERPIHFVDDQKP
jgi:anti-sigma factor ChrR (cupin superfamily)